MQDLKEKEPLVAIELALTRLTNGLGSRQLLRVLERVSYENEVEQDYFDRWTRIGRADGSTATDIIQMKVLHHLTGRFRRGQKVVIGEHVWNNDKVEIKEV
jgi:hypothetical protein